MTEQIYASTSTWTTVEWLDIYNHESIYHGDWIIGGLTSLCAIVGLLGNSTAFSYFWSRRNKTVPDILYIVISATDCCTSALATLPVIISLFNSRDPMLFKNKGFCGFWVMIYSFLLILSMFLVMLISITRTIAIAFPLHNKMKRRTVVMIIVGYTVLILVINGIYLAFEMLEAIYTPRYAACGSHLGTIGSALTEHFYTVSYQAEIALPAFITFISFIISTVSLFRRPTLLNEDGRKYRKVSVTIAIFTAVFLICNIPYFLYQLVNYVEIFWPNNITKTLQYGNAFMFWYGSLVLHFFPVILNAALNPCLYLLRMQNYRKWLQRIFRAKT